MAQRKRVMGRAVPVSEGGSALDAPIPTDGQVLRTSLPDTFDGIRFEIGRMVKYVQEGRKDPLMIDTARMIASNYGDFVAEMGAREGREIPVHNNKTLYVEGIDLWCRQYFTYVNDPPNIEVVQTGRRMVKETKIGRDVVAAIMEPFYRAMEEADPSFDRSSYTPVPKFIGDCDEAAVIFCTLCACLDISPVQFRFGGNDGTLHHVWSRVQADGQWYDSDLTEPGYRLGDFSRFTSYESVEIPL